MRIVRNRVDKLKNVNENLSQPLHSLPMNSPTSIKAVPHPAVQHPRQTQAGTPLVDAQALFGDAHVVLIQHGADTYRLCRTRQGKLILTK